MKVPHEREIEMMPLENIAATPQQAIRRRLRTAKEMVVSIVRGVALGHSRRPDWFIRY